MSDKIQKRLVTFEVITKGDQPVDITPIALDAITAEFHKAVANHVDLRYKNHYGSNDRHQFVGVDIREVR